MLAALRGCRTITWVAGIILVACKGGPGGSGSRISTSTPTTTSACGDLFDALVAYEACSFELVDATKRGRFVQVCRLQLDAPGANAAGAVESCAQAVRSAVPTCAPATTACATPPGMLANGVPCGTSLQCASGYCTTGGGNFENILSPHALSNVIAQSCGVCAPVVPVGGSCLGPPPCARGSVCSFQGSAGTAGGSGLPVAEAGTCVPVPNDVGLGHVCAGPYPSPSCAEGLKCESTKCVALAGEGSPCIFPDDCKAPLVCVQSQCAPPIDAGAQCTIEQKPEGEVSNCSRQSTCDSMTHLCSLPVAIVGPGQPCNLGAFCGTYLAFAGSNAGNAYCRFDGGSYTSGTCPAVFGDGQPCDPSGTCDDYATCGPIPPPMPLVTGSSGAGGPGGAGGPAPTGSAPPAPSASVPPGAPGPPGSPPPPGDGGLESNDGAAPDRGSDGSIPALLDAANESSSTSDAAPPAVCVLFDPSSCK